MNLHVFNPEHDIALAANNKFWTAPHAGRQLRSDLGWLPSLWAEDGDYILVDDIKAAQNAYRKLKAKTADVRFVTLHQLHSINDIDNVMPWGWDCSIVHQLERYGISRDLMPSDDTLALQRAISDRTTASRLLSAMREKIQGTCGESWVVTSMDQLTSKLAEVGKAVVKSPWSSSGRGVRYVIDNNDNRNTFRWAEKALKTQGHLMVERYLNKVKDFGMEFCVLPDCDVKYEGLSLFSTINGAYEGSILATEDEKEEALKHFIDLELLHEVQMFITKWIKEELKGCYVGPFGVDMMIVADDNNYDKSNPSALLNPCVEINLRRTMGHVALSLSPHENGRQEIMRIGYEGTNYHMRIINDHEVYI